MDKFDHNNKESGWPSYYCVVGQHIFYGDVIPVKDVGNVCVACYGRDEKKWENNKNPGDKRKGK